jgi:glyoxylase-like metal-dependent hydrolase (beta-lactamase superfamily II)
MWRPVAGASGAEIFALTNKPSITNSNAYLIRTATRILIIDPGAEPAQVARINELVAESLTADELAGRAREVSLLLSHAHLDHFRAADQLNVGARPRTLVHAAGARAMRGRDRDHTLAILYRNAAIPDLAIDEEFFGDAPLIGGLRRMATIGGSNVAVETIEIGPGIAMEVYPTPGHSTCSVSFRIGRELIIGDVPFGASPGLAGLSGWSSEELRASTHRIRALIAAHEIETCWTGHGRPLAGPAAVETMAEVERQLGDLGEIVRIDEERITLLRQFAIELLREIERLMALVGARLLLAANHLEHLEESEEAARLADAIDFDEIDGLLSEFREFSRGFERGDQPELSVAMKAGATVGRIAQAVERFQPVGPRPLTMIGRIEYLIDAFLQAIRGLMFPLPTAATDLVALVQQMIEREQAPAHRAEEFLAAADDEPAFRRLLAENLISSHALWHCEVHLRSAEPELVAEVDPIAFQMVLLSTLETFASHDDGKVLSVDIERRGGDAVLRIGCGAPPAIPPIRSALYHRAMSRMRGSYTAGAAHVTITAPLA